MATAAQPIDAGTWFSIPRTNQVGRAKVLRADVREALELGESHITVDCGSWQQLDLTILSSLVRCASECREWGASFEVTNMSGKIRADVKALRLHEKLGLVE